MEKRALIAILLSFAVFFGYTKVMEIVYPNYGKPAVEAPVTDVSNPTAASAGLPAGTAAPLNVAAAATAPGLTDEPLPVTTKKHELTYSANHAAFTEVRLTEYPDNQGGAFRFLQSATAATGVGAVDAIQIDNRPVSNLIYTTRHDGKTLHSTADTQELSVEKTWNLAQDGFAHDFSIAITNLTDAPVRLRYRVLTGSKPVVHNSIDEQYIEANWLTADKLQHTRKPAVDKPKSLLEPVIAASMKNRHFSSLFKPQALGNFTAHVEAYDKKDFGSYLVRTEVVLEPGQTLRDGFLWYVGPNRVEDLAPLGLDRIVNFGKLDFIAKILLGGLHMAAGVVGNYGVAIILLTILTNVLMLPLTKTSFMSMRRMQIVQPEVNKLREKYKDNPTKLNEAMMELYKKNKVNPMGGCLPMLLQMPIFMGLYVSLSKAPELLGGRFFWVTDLASPDKIHLPFTLPVIGNSIHLLPLIMVVAMVIQQRLSMSSMATADPNMAQQQKIMMIVMPIVFGFIFYPMPSGLVVYWLTNTLVMSGYQAFLKKSNPIHPITEAA